MPDDTELKISVIVDASGAQAGGQQAASAVEQMAARAKAAFGTVATAPEPIRNSMLVLQNASTQTSETIAAAMKDVEAALAQTATAANAVGASFETAGAQTTAAVTGIDRAMAQATVRIAAMEAGLGGMGMSLGRVAAQSSILGPLLAEAFPIIGIAALAAIAVEGADKIHHLYENIVLLKSAIDELDKVAMKEAEHQAQLNYQYDVANAKLLENEKSYTAATAAYAKASAERPLELPELRDAAEGKEGIKQYSEGLRQVAQSANLMQDAPKVVAAINSEIKATEESMGKLYASQRLIAQGPGILALTGPPQAVQIQSTAAQISDLTAKLNILKGSLSEIQSQKGIAGIGDLEGQTAITKKAAEDAKALAEQIKRDHAAEVEDDRRAGREELDELTRNAEAMKVLHEKEVEDDKTAAREELEEIKRVEDARKKAMEEQSEIDDRTLQASLEAAKLQMDSEDTRLDHQMRMENLNAQQVIALKKEALNQEFAAEESALNQRIAALDANDPDSPKKREKIYDELLKAQQEYNLQSQKLSQQAAEQQQAEWNRIFGSVNHPLEGFVQQVITGNKRISEDFRHLGLNILSSITESLLQAGLKWAEHFLYVEILQKSALAQELADLVTGNATKRVAQTTSNAAEVTGLAGVSAAAAFESAMVALPFPVNIAVAPGVAAGALAQALAFLPVASAAEGFDVPGDILTMLHAKEMVLPAPLAETVRSGVGGAGGSVHINVTAMDHHDVQRFFDKHGDKIARTLKRQVRAGRIG